jgi:catechol 2,3-dioxygenase
MSTPQPAKAAVIHPATQIGVLALTVADLERSWRFYTSVIGFRVMHRTPRSALLGVGARPLLALVEAPGAKPKPTRATGLYHFAILAPRRADLGRWLRHLLEVGHPLDGHSDHRVSEALYLSDPDGNGIEVYRDRPRDEWPWRGGQVQMTLDPLDLRGILAEGDAEGRPWAGLAEGTIIGHMHLQVGDLETAEAFYHGALGFEIALKWWPALFVGAGGYHHHLGLNIFAGAGAPPPPPDSAGLRFFSITLPDEAARAEVVERLEAAGHAVERMEHAIIVRDPWNHRLWLTVGASLQKLPAEQALVIMEAV